MARQVLVTYKVRPDRLAEHEALIAGVFAELARTKPAGLRYGAYKRVDGVSFVHVALVTAERNPLDDLSAFQAFTERIKERLEAPPELTELTTVGSFGL